MFVQKTKKTKSTTEEERPNISKVTVQLKDIQQLPESLDEQVMLPDQQPQETDESTERQTEGYFRLRPDYVPATHIRMGPKLRAPQTLQAKGPQCPGCSTSALSMKNKKRGFCATCQLYVCIAPNCPCAFRKDEDMDLHWKNIHENKKRRKRCVKKCGFPKNRHTKYSWHMCPNAVCDRIWCLVDDCPVSMPSIPAIKTHLALVHNIVQEC